MDPKSVAVQLRKLASDPDNQMYIVREEGCMKGLMGFLDSADSEVLLIALQALQFLSSHPSNHEPLSKHPGLLAKLVGLTDEDANNEGVREVASKTLENLESFINNENKGGSNGGASSSSSSSSESSSSSSSSSAAAARRGGGGTARPAYQKSARGGGGSGGHGSGGGDEGEGGSGRSASSGSGSRPGFRPKALFCIRVNVPGMQSQGSVASVESALLCVRGVVSVAADKKTRLVTVYSRSSDADAAQPVLAAIRKTGLTAEVAEEPQERGSTTGATASTAGATATTDKENTATTGKPSYPSKRPSYPSKAGRAVPARPSYLTPAHKKMPRKGSLVRYQAGGAKQSTLKARLEKQRERKKEEEQKKARAASIFGKVTSYFW